eukprot:g4888.t1
MSGSNSATSSSPPAFSKKRAYVLREFVDTEEKFVRHMKEVVDLYMVPLEEAVVNPDKKTILKLDRVATMFSVIKQIVNLSVPFLDDLKKIDSSDVNFRVGKVMKPIAPYYKLYKVYASNHSNAMSLIERCSTSKPRFRKFLQTVAKSPQCSGQQLGSLLIMPIQRLLRLKMLLERLLKDTPGEHPDREDLEICLRSVSEVADHVNHGISEKENRIKVWEIQQRLVPPPPEIVKPHRMFVLEGILTKVCRRTDKTRHFFLFNDLLVYGPTIRGTNLVNYSNAIALRRAADLPSRQRNGCAFAVFGVPKSFVLVASSRAEKARWLDALYKCCESVESVERRRATIALGSAKNDVFAKDGAPLWVPDNFSPVCMCCGVIKFSKFSLRNRRHHCRRCGVLVCSSCSRHKLMLPSLDSRNPVRVCDKCKARVTVASTPDEDARAAVAEMSENDDGDDDFILVEKELSISDDDEEGAGGREGNATSPRIEEACVTSRRLLRHLTTSSSKGDVDEEEIDERYDENVMQALSDHASLTVREGRSPPAAAAVRSVPVLSEMSTNDGERLWGHHPTSAALRDVPVMQAIRSDRRSLHVQRDAAAFQEVSALPDDIDRKTEGLSSITGLGRRDSHALHRHGPANAATLNRVHSRHRPTSPLERGASLSTSIDNCALTPLTTDTIDVSPATMDRSTAAFLDVPSMVEVGCGEYPTHSRDEYDGTNNKTANSTSFASRGTAALPYVPRMEAIGGSRRSIKMTKPFPATIHAPVLSDDYDRRMCSVDSFRASHDIRRNMPASAAMAASAMLRHAPMQPLNGGSKIWSFAEEDAMQPLVGEALATSPRLVPTRAAHVNVPVMSDIVSVSRNRAGLRLQSFEPAKAATPHAPLFDTGVERESRSRADRW